MKFQTTRNAFQNLRKKLEITREFTHLGIETMKTNVLMWRMFMTSSTKAPIHLGLNYLTKPNFGEKRVYYHSKVDSGEILNV